MYLEKEDVSLYYETYGEGEPLILIHGVIVDAQLYQEAARLLSRYYQVILYDRRGNSRSRLKGEKDFSMDDQADDIRDLLDALGVGRAWIAGASAGAAVGQYFLQKYPERVRHLIMYEPALMGYFMEHDPEYRAWAEHMKDLVARRKYNNAILNFNSHIGYQDPRSPEKPAEFSMRIMENFEYSLREEIPGLIRYNPDIENMREHAGRITLAAGEKSGDTVYARAAVELAGKIGRRPLFYPGGHNLPWDLPEEFAVCVFGTLKLLAE